MPAEARDVISRRGEIARSLVSKVRGVGCVFDTDPH